jgi:hypothetical protein
MTIQFSTPPWLGKQMYSARATVLSFCSRYGIRPMGEVELLKAIRQGTV